MSGGNCIGSLFVDRSVANVTEVNLADLDYENTSNFCRLAYRNIF